MSTFCPSDGLKEIEPLFWFKEQYILLIIPDFYIKTWWEKNFRSNPHASLTFKKAPVPFCHLMTCITV